MNIEFRNSPQAIQAYREYLCGGRFVEAKVAITLTTPGHIVSADAHIVISESGKSAAVILVTRREQVGMGFLASLEEALTEFRKHYVPESIADDAIEWFHIWEWTGGGHRLEAATPIPGHVLLRQCVIPAEPMSIEGCATGPQESALLHDARALDDICGGYRAYAYRQDGLAVVVIIDAAPEHRRSLEHPVRAVWEKLIHREPETSSLRWYLRGADGRCKQLPRAWAHRCQPAVDTADRAAGAGTALAA